ncbi:MAG TPA: helical backbone metal receptor [Candidatus Rifleibacterium sp.]|nr:helical backbone metal receptor [Candidatus Rifleibacterium sp.]HPT45542.1 helical backbone metal receptor [Candidatus Rifleibacterium sp.]
MPRRIIYLMLVFLTCLSALPAAENRIIALVPSQTELLFSLGFGTDVVGVSDFCNFPVEAAAVTKVGGLELNIERIVSLRPTLLVDANNMHRKYEPLFQQLGLKYINFVTTRLEHLPTVAAELARLLGAPGKGEVFVRDWETKLRQLDLKKAALPVAVYFEIWDTPAQAAGQGSFIGELIARAGGTNIVTGSGDFPVVSSEGVISGNPEVILVAYPLPDLAKIRQRPGWASIRAVKNNRIKALDQDIFVRPGPRNLDAISQLIQIFHEVKPHE